MSAQFNHLYKLSNEPHEQVAEGLAPNRIYLRMIGRYTREFGIAVGVLVGVAVGVLVGVGVCGGVGVPRMTSSR